jgi:hypothetical protein
MAVIPWEIELELIVYERFVPMKTGIGYRGSGIGTEEDFIIES